MEWNAKKSKNYVMFVMLILLGINHKNSIDFVREIDTDKSTNAIPDLLPYQRCKVNYRLQKIAQRKQNWHVRMWLYKTWKFGPGDLKIT